MGGEDVGKRTAEGGSEGRTISVDELDQITKNFADRYVLFLANVCDDIKRQSTSPEERRIAHRLKLTGAAAAYDVATGPDPVKQLVDMAVLVELHHIVWVDEGQSVLLFGADLGGRLTQALDMTQAEIWGLSSRVMTPEQILALKEAIQGWRREHPEVEWISDIRFDVVAGGEGVTLIGGTLGTLTAASGSVTDSIGQSRLLGQRVFYYSKRLPMLLDWQLEAALENALTVPAASQSIERISAVLESAADLLPRMDSPTGAWQDALGSEIDPRFREIRETLSDGKELAVTVRQAAEAIDGLLEGVRQLTESPASLEPSEEARKPFDITEYTAAAMQFAKTVQEARELLHETRDFAEDESARPEVAEMMNSVVGDFAREARDTTDHVAWRAAELMILFAALLSLYTGILLRLAWRRRRGADRNNHEPVTPRRES